MTPTETLASTIARVQTVEKAALGYGPPTLFGRPHMRIRPRRWWCSRNFARLHRRPPHTVSVRPNRIAGPDRP
jgi:hypothetical protein